MVFVYRGVGWGFFVYFVSAVKVFAYRKKFSRTVLVFSRTHTPKHTNRSRVYTEMNPVAGCVYTRRTCCVYATISSCTKVAQCVYTPVWEWCIHDLCFKLRIHMEQRIRNSHSVYEGRPVCIHTNHVRVHTEDCAYTHEAIYVYT